MRHSPILAATAAALIVSGCSFTARADGGTSEVRTFAVGGFTGIEVAGPYQVTVRTGPAPSVSASGSEKSLDRLRVEVKDGLLEIAPVKESGWFGWNRAGPVRLTVTVPSLDRARIAGSGEISIDKVRAHVS